MNLRKAKFTLFGTQDGPVVGTLTGERETTATSLAGVTEVINDPYFPFPPEAHLCLSYWWTVMIKFRKKPLSPSPTSQSPQSSQPAKDNDQGLEEYPSKPAQVVSPQAVPASAKAKAKTARPFPIDSIDSTESTSKLRKVFYEVFQPGGPTTKVQEAVDAVDSEGWRQLGKLSSGKETSQIRTSGLRN